MKPASEVPVVRECAFFVCAEEGRLRAVDDALAATDDPSRLGAVLLVTNLYDRQMDEVRSDVLPDVQAAYDDDPEAAKEAADWVSGWLDEAKAGYERWGETQESLVARLGRSEAEAIAEGPAAERMQAVIDATKERLQQRINHLQQARAEAQSAIERGEDDDRSGADGGGRKFPKDQIDRMVELEKSLGIELSALGAKVTQYGSDISIELVGEVAAPAGLKQDIELVAVLYDEDGDALERSTASLYVDQFAGFDTFWIYFSGVSSLPARIRIYPRAS